VRQKKSIKVNYCTTKVKTNPTKHLCSFVCTCIFCFQSKEEKKADSEEIRRLNEELQRLRNALKEAKNRSKQV